MLKILNTRSNTHLNGIYLKLVLYQCTVFKILLERVDFQMVHIRSNHGIAVVYADAFMIELGMLRHPGDAILFKII